MAPLVIVPCGRQKLSRPAPARELYTGCYAVACRRYGESIARAIGADVVILSANYGFVELDEVIAPYDVTFGDEGEITFAVLSAQAQQLGVRRPVHVVAGRRYLDVVNWHFTNVTAVLPPSGGIGGQLAWLRQHTAHPPTQ